MQGVTTQPARPLDGMLYDEVFAVPGEGHIVDCVNPLTDRSCINGETLEEVRLRYPNAIRVTWEEWRAGQMERQNRPVSWSRVTEEQYREMLEVLPPVDWDGGSFMVGEASDHSYETGKPRFQA